MALENATFSGSQVWTWRNEVIASFDFPAVAGARCRCLPRILGGRYPADSGGVVPITVYRIKIALIVD